MQVSAGLLVGCLGPRMPGADTKPALSCDRTKAAIPLARQESRGVGGGA